MKRNKIHKITDDYLKEEYGFLRELGLEFLHDFEKYQIPEYVQQVYVGPCLGHFAAACQCYYLFRRLHEKAELEPVRATLLGDYFFSRFSHHLIPVDSTLLIQRFSEFLTHQTECAAEGRNKFDLEGYKTFIKNVSLEVFV